jgi:hypothetical protein
MTIINATLKPSYGLVVSSIYIGIGVFIMAYLANYYLEETFHKDLNYSEE